MFSQEHVVARRVHAPGLGVFAEGVASAEFKHDGNLRCLSWSSLHVDKDIANMGFSWESKISCEYSL
jgi:hypothetical protein